MHRLLASALLVLFLPACGTLSGASAKPPNNDLDALVTNVERQLPDRALPSGKQYCMEDAATEGAQDRCGGQLEVLNLQRDGDRTRAISVLRRGVDWIKASRLDCGFFAFTCKRERKALQRGPPPE